MSLIHGSMTRGSIDLEKWRRMEERLRTMEEDDGGVSMVSGAMVTRPVNVSESESSKDSGDDLN